MSSSGRKRPYEEGRLFVGNVAFETTEAELKETFQRFGQVRSVSLPKDKSGAPKGFAFVTLDDDPSKAVDQNIELGGRTLRISLADNKRDRGNEKRERYVWGKPEEDKKEEEDDVVEKEKPNFGLSGALAKDDKTGNMRRGHVLKFVEPEDAAVPTRRWRIYVFKDDAIAETLHIHRQSSFLVGRLKDIADVLTIHPSISSQHAVIQFRRRNNSVVPYVMDLGSTNGSFLNKEKLDPARYYEIHHKDVINFGNSSRDYVFLLADS